MSAAAGAEAEVWLYDEIGVWGIGAAEFADEVGALDVDTLTVRINSPGGGVFAGLAIANVLIRHRARVRVTVDGLAASIASVIAMAGDEVLMGRGSQMMIHMAGGLVLGDAEEMRRMANLLDKVSRDSIAAAYHAKAGGKIGDWLAAMAEETWYSAPEAVDAGLADAVEDTHTEPAAAGRRGDVTARWQRHDDQLLGAGSYWAWSAAATARDMELRAGGGQEPDEPKHDVQITASPRGTGWQRRTRGSLAVDLPHGAHRPNTPAAVSARACAHTPMPVLAVPPSSAARRRAASDAAKARTARLRRGR